MPTTLDRDRLLTIMRHKNHGMAQIRHMIALLTEAANLVPDYPAFQSVCAESLRQAWRGVGTLAQGTDFKKALGLLSNESKGYTRGVR